MTITAVSRTHTFKNGSYNADCDFNKDGIDEVGRELNCSGTDASLIAWNEANNAFASHGVFYGIGQTEVTFRFGTGQGYRWFKDPFVLKAPNHDAFVWSMAVMDGAKRTLYLNGVVPSAYRNYVDRDASMNVVPLATRSDEDDNRTMRAGWPSAVSSTDATARIGKGRFDAPSGYWAGDLAELIIYDRPLTSSEQTRFMAT